LDTIFSARTVALIGTGPTLTPEQIDTARRKGFALAGCNSVWEIVPDLALLYGCNLAWWRHYWSPALKAHPAQKWTTNREAADTFGLRWIAERAAMGLSTDPRIVHHGHGSGYTLLNLAYLMGAARIVLLGYSLAYAPDYDGKARQPGATPRHYFGEYPVPLQHWPSAQVRAGVHVELLELYRSVARQGLIEIVNCTPGSALDCFRKADIADVD
jgi:hypothetical protein